MDSAKHIAEVAFDTIWEVRSDTLEQGDVLIEFFYSEAAAITCKTIRRNARIKSHPAVCVSGKYYLLERENSVEVNKPAP